MATLNLVCFLMLVIWLHSSSIVRNNDIGVHATSAEEDAPYMARVGFRATHDNDDKTDEIGKLVNHVRYEITNRSTLAYKEQVEDLTYKVDGSINDGYMYNMTMRLNETDCKITNASCDPSFHSAFIPSGKQTQIIAALEPPMSSGKEIEVQGIIPMKSKGFQITIQTGYEEPRKGQLRINVECAPSVCELKLEYYNEAWNLHSHYNGPLTPKQAFQILIVCLDKAFEIYINGKIFVSIDHVIPYKDATHLSIFGDLTVIGIFGVTEFFLPVKNFKPSKSWLDDNIQYQYPPYMPFVAHLASTLSTGKSIRIKGLVPMYSNRFAITIQYGSDIAPGKAQLRLLAVFSKGGKQNKITLSYCDDTWQGEQVKTQVLRPGHTFDIVITCRSDHFQISIDGKKFANFHYQLPLKQATHLSVLGMVNITEVVGISEVPPVAFLDKPLVTPSNVHLKNVTLTSGRKLRIWTYILKDNGINSIAIQLLDAKKITVYAHLELAFQPNGSIYLRWNTAPDGKWGQPKDFHNTTWLKRGQPLQIELSCLEKSYKVTFDGMWSYDFEYRLPLKKTELIQFPHKGYIVYAVDGVSAIPLPPPPPPPVPSRVCSVLVWYKPSLQKTSIRNLVCTKNGTSLKHQLW